MSRVKVRFRASVKFRVRIEVAARVASVKFRVRIKVAARVRG